MDPLEMPTAVVAETPASGNGRGEGHTNGNGSGWHRRRRVGRPSTVAPYAPVIAAWLAHDPMAPGAELLRRAQREGYTGGKSALYELIRRLRPAPQSAE